MRLHFGLKEESSFSFPFIFLPKKEGGSLWGRKTRNTDGLVSKVRSVRLRTLAAEEFHASIFAALRPARKFDPGVCTHLADFQTAPENSDRDDQACVEKLRSPARPRDEL